MSVGKDRKLENWDVGPNLEAFPTEETLQQKPIVMAPAEGVTPAEDAAIAPTHAVPGHPGRGIGAGGLWLVLLAVVVGGGYRYGREVTQRLAVPNQVATADAPPSPREAATSPQPIEPPEPRSSSGLPPILPAPTAPARPLPESATPLPESPTPSRPVENVSGPWALVTHVESSRYSRYTDLRLGYRIQLEQAGEVIKGSGRKITEDGAEISPRAQTPIVVGGTIDGDRLTLKFDEQGARRPTEGKFVLLLDETGTLRGRFSSTAAQSSGTVEAHRLLQ